MGIAAEEAGSFTGQVVALKAAWSDFMVDVGTQLLPMLTPLLTNFGVFAREVLPLVVTWVGEKLVPAFEALGLFITTTLLPAFATFSAWITETLVPTLQTMWDWFEINILPTLAAVADVVSALLVGAFGALKNTWEDLNPLLEAFVGWIDGLLAPIDGISGAVERLVEWLGKLAEAIRSQPDPNYWYKSRSPTPFEKGLRGIAKAIEMEVNPQLGKFGSQLQASMGNGMGGSTTTSYDQRSYFQGATVDVPNENMLDLLAKNVRRMG